MKGMQCWDLSSMILDILVVFGGVCLLIEGDN